MIINDLKQFKINTSKRINKKLVRDWNGIKISIGFKKIKIKCDICGKIWNGILHNYFDKSIHKCRSCFIGEIHKGMKHSEETKRKISLKRKNQIIIHSEETKRKMSESHKGKILTVQHKENLSKALKGRIITQEQRKKISESMKGRTFSKDVIKRISNTLKGHYVSKKTRMKQSIKAKERILKMINNKFVGYSKISQELFWKIYEQIKNDFKDIHFATLNQKTKESDWSGRNWEYKIKTNKTCRYIDFYIKDINLGIEFDNDVWHNKEDDLIRENEIKEVNPFIKLFRINEKDEYKLNKGLNFIYASN